MVKRVKLYEEKRRSWTVPLWVWILGLVVVLTLLFLFFTHRERPMERPTVSELVGGLVGLQFDLADAAPVQQECGVAAGEKRLNWSTAPA